MDAPTLLLASGDVEYPTLLIIDWSAAFLSFAFLFGGLISLYVARHPVSLVERFGGAGLLFGSVFAFLYSSACMLHGGISLVQGTLPTPNGTVFHGFLAYAGGTGFVVLGLFLTVSTLRNLRAVQSAFVSDGNLERSNRSAA